MLYVFVSFPSSSTVNFPGWELNVFSYKIVVGAVITGASFVPFTSIRIVCWAVAPLSSVTVAVNVSVLLSPVCKAFVTSNVLSKV